MDWQCPPWGSSMSALTRLLLRPISRRWRFQRDGAVGLQMHGGVRCA